MCSYKKDLITFILSIACVLAASSNAGAQGFALKSDMLNDAAGSLNFGVEQAMSRHQTAEIVGYLNPWTYGNGAFWKHAYVQPAWRWWFCDVYSGHFVGFHLHGGIFNVGNIDTDFKFLGNDFSVLRDSRAQGWFAGAGVSYGYDYILNRNWNLEFEIGIGYAYSLYDRYECEVCGTILEENIGHHYFGPTKAAITLVYLF